MPNIYFGMAHLLVPLLLLPWVVLVLRAPLGLAPPTLEEEELAGTGSEWTSYPPTW